MSKETRWLLIFAGIFLVIGVIASLLISGYSENAARQKALKDYKGFFPKMVDVVVDEEFAATQTVIKKEKVLDKNKQVIGYAYTATITVENTIPMKESAELKLLVGIGLDDKVAGVATLLSEHTKDFYDKYEAEYDKLTNSLKNDFQIDTVAGSTVSAGIINDILKEVKNVHLGIDLTSYEEIFGEGAIGIVDESFTGNEIVTEKAAVYDSENNLLGYAYTGTVKDTVLSEQYDVKGDLSLMVGITTDGKIVGVTEVENGHTSSYYNKYSDALGNLSDKAIAELAIDSITGSTVSGTTLNKILAAIKEVISNE